MSNTTLETGQPIGNYQLIVPLSEALEETVLRLRSSFYGRYKIPLPDLAKPALSILECSVAEGLQDVLVERIEQALARTPEFLVVLENFAATATNTICIPMAANRVLAEMENSLKGIKSLTHQTNAPAIFNPAPQVLIAQNLKPFQFIRMWMDCEHQRFTGHCNVREMVLQKQSETAGFETVKRFALACPSREVEQGVLFG